MRAPHVVTATLLTSLALLAACGDDASTDPPAPALTSVTVTPPSASVAVGATSQLNAQALDQNGTVFPGATVAWSTGAATIATVSAAGLVTGVAPGTATITATATSGSVTRTGTSTITVTAPVAGAVVAGAAANTFTPADLTIAVNGTVTWTFGARPHNVVFGTTAGAPANVPITSNATVSRTFPTAGTFTYDCTLHSGMRGTVTVR
ncbi:MAG: Ig-like domain-containing protein [Gemmatimonadaceae bacterium]|jgi:plastocyanin|nr:Ig-like domain-containing protein [Gemmatimonadaceae bacterium]